LNTEYNKNQCRNLNLSRDINYYVKHNKKVDNGTLKKIILRDNLLTYKCAECTIESTYNGKPLTLQLDHIDGNNGNNELSNLRFLCPNCHSQTETFGARNKKRKKTKNERLSLRHQRNLQKYKNDIEKVKNSNIDFSKYGWVIKVANLLGRKHQKITKWMKIYMPEFYQDRCYK
jgi:5-methylcytosine-specific restriction endonuclease McrA